MTGTLQIAPSIPDSSVTPAGETVRGARPAPGRGSETFRSRRHAEIEAMIAACQPGGMMPPLDSGTPPARTDGPVADPAQQVAVELVGAEADTDGDDLDRVEHARMMRLHRYQRQP